MVRLYIKIVLIGNGAIGKTALSMRYSTDSFPDEYIPTVYECIPVTVSLDSKTILLEIVDTASDFEFEYYRQKNI